jgi:hypothetical protein
METKKQNYKNIIIDIKNKIIGFGTQAKLCNCQLSQVSI